MVREVAALYAAYAVGAESPLKELNLQYGDYAVWQREWLQGEVLEQQLAYWRKQLAGAPRPGVADGSAASRKCRRFAARRCRSSYQKSWTEELRALSRREGVTLYMTLLAGLQTLLARYTGQEDISKGTPIANRRRGELENLIGFFVNTLVLRTDLSGNPTFHELVQRVKETALGAYAHQDVPFEMLVESFQPERSMSYTPLFQVLFVLQNAPQEKLELSGLTVELLDIDSGTAKFDLMLSLEESEDGLEGSANTVLTCSTKGPSVDCSDISRRFLKAPSTIQTNTSRSCRCCRRRNAVSYSMNGMRRQSGIRATCACMSFSRSRRNTCPTMSRLSSKRRSWIIAS